MSYNLEERYQAWFAISTDTDMYRSSGNRKRGDQYDTDPRIMDIIISVTTRSDLADIDRFKSVMHNIGQYIRINSDIFLNCAFFYIL